MARRGETPEGPTLKSVVTSYVMAQMEEEGLEKNLAGLRNFLAEKGIAKLSKEQLRKIVLRQKKEFDDMERRVKRLSRLFNSDGEVRKAKYRRGEAFCDRCGLFKNFSKECPHCSKLEITL